jgi:hypothetical protein
MIDKDITILYLIKYLISMVYGIKIINRLYFLTFVAISSFYYDKYNNYKNKYIKLNYEYSRLLKNY